MDHERSTWLEANPKLFVSLNPNLPEDDIFTNTMMDFVIPQFHQRFGERLKLGQAMGAERGYVTYRDSTIVKFSNVLVTIIASILPPITILVLNALSTTTSRIMVTVAFTAAFATILVCLTSARRVEILAATAT